MATKFDASGDILKRTTNLPAPSAFTLCAWVRVVSVRASQYQYFVELANGTTDAGSYLVLGYNNIGAFEISTGVSSQSFASNPTTGSWMFVALTSDGTTLRGYWSHAGSAFVTASITTLSFTSVQLSIGNDSYNEYCDVEIENVYVYDAALTQAELEQQMYRALPVRTANLNIWSRLQISTDVTDYSGNGRNWTSGGTLASASGPPLAWGAPVLALPYAAAAGAIEGAVATTLAALTGAATGTVDLTGTLSKTLAALTGVATGTLDDTNIDGVLTQTLGALTGAATGTVAIAGTATKTLEALTAVSKGYHLESVCVGGTIQVGSSNARYFSNGAAPILLSGFHTWETLVDHGDSDPPDAFDYDAFLDALEAKGVNFIKLWACESLRDWCDAVKFFYPFIYDRTGPGNAADGKLKVDLTRFNPVYFERLRERAIEAGNRGMYVCVQLFQGWQVTQKGYSAGAPGTYHPFNAANNVNSIDGDIDNDGQVGETRDVSWTAVYDLQKAYVRAVIDAVNDLDHIIYEISNEEDEVDNAAGHTKVEWQHALIDYIHTYEAGLSKQHPVGMTVQWPDGSDSDLFSSNAEWISPKDSASVTSVTASNGDKVILWDTDHVIGLTDEHEWIWMAVTRGCNPLYMDEWDGDYYGTDKRSTAANVKIRDNLGYVQSWAATNIDLANATPQSSLASTGYCLAKTTGIVQVLAYQPTSGNFTVNLTSYAGTFAVEWLRPATGATQAGSDVSGGAVRTLTPPWAGEDAVALLELTGTDGTLSKTLDALTGAATGALALAGAVSKTLDNLTGAATGTVVIVATAATTLGDMVATVTATVAIAGATDSTLDHMSVASTATVAIAGTAASTLDSLTSAATGELTAGPTGALAAMLGALTGTATGTLDLAATLDSALESLTGEAVAALAIAGALAATLDSLTATATGVGADGAWGEVVVTLDSLTGAATSALALAGESISTLDALTSGATGAVAITGAANVILGDMTSMAAGVAALVIAIVTGSVTGPRSTGNAYGPRANGQIGR